MKKAEDCLIEQSNSAVESLKEKMILLENKIADFEKGDLEPFQLFE